MNPTKMRTSYGKLMYMLQDALSCNAQDELGLNLWQPLVMVPTFLQVFDRKDTTAVVAVLIVQFMFRGLHSWIGDTFGNRKVNLIISNLDTTFTLRALWNFFNLK